MQTVNEDTVKRYIQGDTEAFDAIFHQYSKRIYHIALGLLKNSDLAEDIVQEVFVKLWMKRERVDPKLTFENYVLTVAYNTIRNALRHHAIKSKMVDRLLKEAPEIIEDTDAKMIYTELLELSSKAIEKLPPKRRKVYKLSRQEGMKIKEIAAKLDISSRTVEDHLSKALKFLKEELSNYSALSLIFFYLFLN